LKRRRVLLAALLVAAPLASCDLILDLPHPARDGGAPEADGNAAGASGADGAADATGASDAPADVVVDVDAGVPTGPLPDAATWCDRQREGENVLFCDDFDGPKHASVTRYGDLSEVDASNQTPPDLLRARSDGGTGAMYEPYNIDILSGSATTYTLEFRLSWPAGSRDPLLFARVTVYDGQGDGVEVWAGPPVLPSGDVPIVMVYRPNTGPLDGGAVQAPTIAGSQASTWHNLSLNFPFDMGEIVLTLDGDTMHTARVSAPPMTIGSSPVLGLGIFQGLGSGDFDSVVFTLTP
jgi:hypothetical protein